MKFRVEIECDNEAFGVDEYETWSEVIYVMRTVDDNLRFHNNRDLPLFDHNGNKVGRAWFEEDE